MTMLLTLKGFSFLWITTRNDQMWPYTEVLTFRYASLLEVNWFPWKTFSLIRQTRDWKVARKAPPDLSCGCAG